MKLKRILSLNYENEKNLIFLIDYGMIQEQESISENRATHTSRPLRNHILV